MHSKNIHNTPYDFDELINTHSPLTDYVFLNKYDQRSIDFSSSEAVYHLNKAILKHHYHIDDWKLPKDYLCPPIPGRADYIHHIADLLHNDGIQNDIRGLDIGVGANCIYPILATQLYRWKMVGADINLNAINSAKNNVALTAHLKDFIEIRHQQDNACIFKNIILDQEYYHFTVCNPPFHASEKEATKGSLRKLKNLKNQSELSLNFGGQANELWCNGGEALFIKRMIKQSVEFKHQVGWFTTLVSKKSNLENIYKLLKKYKTTYQTIEMSQGKKQSRFVAWKFEE